MKFLTCFFNKRSPPSVKVNFGGRVSSSVVLLITASKQNWISPFSSISESWALECLPITSTIFTWTICPMIEVLFPKKRSMSSISRINFRLSSAETIFSFESIRKISCGTYEFRIFMELVYENPYFLRKKLLSFSEAESNVASIKSIRNSDNIAGGECSCFGIRGCSQMMRNTGVGSILFPRPIDCVISASVIGRTPIWVIKGFPVEDIFLHMPMMIKKPSFGIVTDVEIPSELQIMTRIWSELRVGGFLYWNRFQKTSFGCLHPSIISVAAFTPGAITKIVWPPWNETLSDNALSCLTARSTADSKNLLEESVDISTTFNGPCGNGFIYSTSWNSTSPSNIAAIASRSRVALITVIDKIVGYTIRFFWITANAFSANETSSDETWISSAMIRSCRPGKISPFVEITIWLKHPYVW